MEIIFIITLVFIITVSIFGVVNMIKQINKPKLDNSKSILTYHEWHRNRDRMAEQFAKDNPPKKQNTKQDLPIQIQDPLVNTRKKQKPKTVAEWEETHDLGGHE